MPSPIITKAQILAEFNRLKTQPQSAELSTPEICERVAFRLCIDVEACVAEVAES